MLLALELLRRGDVEVAVEGRWKLRLARLPLEEALALRLPHLVGALFCHEFGGLVGREEGL